MANLSAAELTKRPGRLALFISMIENGSPMTVQTKTGVRQLTFSAKENKAALDALKNAIGKPNATDVLNRAKITIVHPKEGDLTLTKFVKSAEFKTTQSGANKGDLAEAIFGAALVARFVSRNRNINRGDVEEALHTLVQRGKKKDTNGKYHVYEAPAANEKNDNVYFYLSLPKMAFEFLDDRRQWKNVTDLFDSSVKYANNDKVRAWANLFYHNGVYDYIEVLSAGLDDQTGTKVDVRVQVRHGSKDVPAVKTDINVSLKAGNVKQFGQIGGAAFTKQKDLWLRLATVDITQIEDKYNILISQGKVEEALKLSYEYVEKQMKYTLKDKHRKHDFLKRLGDGIRYFATLNEDSVELVQLESGKAKVFSFDKIHDILTTLDVDVKVEVSANKPRLTFFGVGSGKAFLEVRAKAETTAKGFYIRNYVEKGPLMTDLLAIVS